MKCGLGVIRVAVLFVHGELLYMDRSLIWNYWLNLQKDNGIVPREEGFKPYSAFDIKRINKENLKSIQLYLNKYISKNRTNLNVRFGTAKKKYLSFMLIFILPPNF